MLTHAYQYYQHDLPATIVGANKAPWKPWQFNAQRIHAPYVALDNARF